MTREEKITAAKEAVLAVARETLPLSEVTDTTRQIAWLERLASATQALVDAEKPERPRLMMPTTRASLYTASPGAILLAVVDDHAHIAAVIGRLPRYWTQLPIGVDGLITEPLTQSIECVALADVIDLIEGR